MNTTQYRRGIPHGYDGSEAYTLVIPRGADPDMQPDVQRKVADGWIVGETYPQGGNPRLDVVYMYPPR